MTARQRICPFRWFQFRQVDHYHLVHIYSIVFRLLLYGDSYQRSPFPKLYYLLSQAMTFHFYDSSRIDKGTIYHHHEIAIIPHSITTQYRDGLSCTYFIVHLYHVLSIVRIYRLYPVFMTHHNYVSITRDFLRQANRTGKHCLYRISF